MGLRAVYHRRRAQARAARRVLLRIPDRGTWAADGILGCAYPRSDRALAALSRQGVSLLVNLHERPHDPRRLERHGMRELHLPVRDFHAPSPVHIERGVDVLVKARKSGEVAAVHCGAGLGRTGTLLACYLVCTDGIGAAEAIERIRRIRPGSVETSRQEEAIEAMARTVLDSR